MPLLKRAAKFFIPLLYSPIYFYHIQETSQSELAVPAITVAAAPNGFTSPGSTNHSFSKSHMLPLHLRPMNRWVMVKSDSTCVQMISYDGSDFTTASVSKKSSPVVQSAGKVIKSIFVPNVGWASQVSSTHSQSGISRGVCDQTAVSGPPVDERRGVGPVQRRVSAGGAGRSFLHHIHVSRRQDHKVRRRFSLFPPAEQVK